MLFQNSFVSFVAAIALATSVSASAIAARGIVPTCPAGLSPYCCDSEPSFTGLPTNVQNSLKGAAPALNQNEPVGQNCVVPPAQGCPDGGKPLCCPILQNVDGTPYGVNCQTPTNGSNGGNGGNGNGNGGNGGN